MITLYYSPFSCSLAVYIMLEMIGEEYQAVRVETGSEAYKKIAPKGAVPALKDGDGPIMTQIVALFHYLSHKYPHSRFARSSDIHENYQLDSVLACINADIHPAFHGFFAPQKATIKTDAGSVEAVKEAAKNTIAKQFYYLDEMLAGKHYLVGDTLSSADLYAFVVSNWGWMSHPDTLKNYKNIIAFQENIKKIPEVQKIVSLQNN